MSFDPATFRQLRTIHSLRPENTFASAIVGDNWVVTAIAHIDRLGRQIIPLRVRRSFYAATNDGEMNTTAITEALERCWTTMGGGNEFEYSKFILCLPPRITRSRISASSISTRPQNTFHTDRATITPAHLRDLQNRVCRDGFWPHYAVADFIPLTYHMDGERLSRDPIGKSASKLDLRAHLVLADQDFTREVLCALKELNIDIDVLMSSHAAVAGNLPRTEKDGDSVLVDVDRQTCACSFFKDGNMSHTEWVEGGSYTILEGAANRLKTKPEELALWLNERENITMPENPAPDGLLPLYPSWRSEITSLVDLDLAARKAAESIAAPLKNTIENTSARMGRPIRRVILTGDDNLTLRALMATLYQSGLICEWRNPSEHLPEGDTTNSTPGLARLTGLMNASIHASCQRQPFLESYNDVLINRIGHGIQKLNGRVRNWLEERPSESRSQSVAPRPSKERPLAGAVRQLLF
ncbi:MAG: hypothetical protein ISS35_07705 [Kiritimatiellae bacterium]|nr:hypothetical protein [Kiritimatiellia bacterium]